MGTDKPLKILLVLPFFYPHRGGSQKYAEELYAEILEKHQIVTVDVLCYNTDKASTKETYRNFNIYRVPCWNVIPARFALANPFYLVKQLNDLSKNNYNFVNTHIRFFDTTWWVWIYAKLIKAKSFYTGHVYGHPVHQLKLVEMVAKLADLTIARFSLSKYDILSFTNKTAQEFYNKVLGTKGKQYLIYGGINTKYFIPKSKNTERILPKLNKKVDTNQILITFVGRLIWTKGVTFLLDAAKEVLKTRHEDILFVFGGPGELEDSLERQIKVEGLEDKILLTKDLTYEQVKDLLGITNIFVNPSNHNEGFPNTILEAGSCECLVIATDNAGTKEVINPDTGILIPQRSTESIIEAIIWALDNKDKAEKISRNFREQLVKDFDWEIIAEQQYKMLLSQA